MTKYSIGVAAVMFLVAVTAGGSPENSGPPDWYLENIRFLTAGSGTWVADNSDYKSNEEAWDDYILEWRAGPGGYSMSGRMFGMTNGERSDTAFWLFSQFWDPVQKVAVVQQYGWGIVGIGTMEPDAEGNILMQQTFTGFDGTSSAQAHRASNPSDVTHRTVSYDIAEDGRWIERRRYEWVRQP